MKILTKGQYYGNPNSEVSFDGVLLSHYSYTGDKTDWHYHENPYFMYVLRGNMMDCNKKAKSLCPPGSLMFNNWQEVHFGSKHSDRASGFHLEFERSWLKKMGVSQQLLEGSQLIEHPRVHLAFAKLFHEFAMPDSYSVVSVEVLLLQICEVLSKIKEANTAETPSWIGHLKELLHYDSHDFSLQYLSNQLDVHPVHISRAAPKYLSMSLGEYIRQQKIKKAIPLILDPTRSLTEIAYQVGFADQSHFNRVFKSFFKMNPSVYRGTKKISLG
ncbi:helix-turn-helix transcriptional regulator [Flavobacteriaceae bacterium TP-CH-4]|uniref:Helix-turn-helix transcriptional regulator n=1 Tax=Pelagihabitans pacificus TaxID=2696054 RepID=A0A967ARX9_9FLAO|nr:helix-turn-helix transcriptional regulator [Pelagihabitans pacificus]NHF57823.1 helix-turn-helix transcriptional regulator [Pelagihabitans pacificus]